MEGAGGREKEKGPFLLLEPGSTFSFCTGSDLSHQPWLRQKQVPEDRAARGSRQVSQVDVPVPRTRRQGRTLEQLLRGSLPGGWAGVPVSIRAGEELHRLEKEAHRGAPRKVPVHFLDFKSAYLQTVCLNVSLRGSQSLGPSLISGALIFKLS